MTQRLCLLLFVTLLLWPGTANALVDPSLQPGDLCDRYRSVIRLTVAGFDDDARTVTLDVDEVLKGVFQPNQVVVSLADESVQDAFEAALREDQCVVAFVGKDRRRREKEILFYGGEGRWQMAVLQNLEDMSRWIWTKDLDPGNDSGNVEHMYGTFNGDPQRLAEMAADRAAGRYFHPAIPFDQFQEDRVIGRFPMPIRGVALYDVDLDGDLDVYACSPGGDRLYVQTASFAFADGTAELGLGGNRSVSVSLADANADGLPDLLLDGALWLQNGDPGATKFTRSDLLPAAANENVKSSAFVELNGDGFPDVVVSRIGGGLTALLNPGTCQGGFADATAALGLKTEDEVADGNGFFTAGDFNDDGRTDLFYAGGPGHLFVQDEAGHFTRTGNRRFDFRTDGELQGLTGAGCFAPLWRTARPDLVVVSESSVNLIANLAGTVQDVTAAGNELTESSFAMLGAVAEDLNMDGLVDLYVSSRQALPGAYYVNRGYGSFMTPEKYRSTVFPGQAHQRGAWGLAAGDVNGDGANDLLLGGVDGTLTLLVNDTLGLRTPTEHPTYHEKILQQTTILTAEVRARTGAVGAKVVVTDADGRIVARRDVGSNIGTGNCGPASVNLALRRPGVYQLNVRFADGSQTGRSIDVTGRQRHLTTVIDKPTPHDTATGD